LRSQLFDCPDCPSSTQSYSIFLICKFSQPLSFETVYTYIICTRYATYNEQSASSAMTAPLATTSATMTPYHHAHSVCVPPAPVLLQHQQQHLLPLATVPELGTPDAQAVEDFLNQNGSVRRCASQISTHVWLSWHVKLAYFSVDYPRAETGV